MISQEIADLKDEMIRLRRDFHQHPELGFEEKRTASIVAKYLDDLGLEVQTGIGRTGVVGLLSGNGRGKTLLLRADMDALPVQEQNEVQYRSQNDGIMHACGHDGHMAILIAAARILSAHREEFPGQVKFAFQPGEEGFGGAKFMIEDGVLKNPKVDAALALHLITFIPYGMIGIRTGPLMASMDSFSVRITGKGGHAAMPEGGVDSILMSAHAITALQSLISKEVSPLSPLVVHVGTIHGGQAFNIIAEKVEFKGTVRTLDEALQKTVPERVDRILRGVVEGLRGKYELDYEFAYPIVNNDGAMTDLVKRAAAEVVGEEKVFEVSPFMTSDDMAFFLREVRGCYFCVGAGNAEKGADQPHHNSRFNVDEDALTVGAEVMILAAMSYLTAK